MRIFGILSLFILASCAHDRTPASLASDQVAKDSIALGNVRAVALKQVEKDNVCFDISLYMKGVEKNQAMSSNWTLAWVDQESKYHLLPLTQREPASSPVGETNTTAYGTYNEWKNSFRPCAPRARLNDVKALILTPKELSYPATEGLKLEWN